MANEPIRIKIRSAELRVIDMKLRIPFKFGIATLTDIPQLTMRIVAEDESGRTATGYSADVLPALWFDKASDKSIDQKIEDQITMARLAGEFYLDQASGYVTPFDLWWSVYPELKREADRLGINALTAGFGSSFAERAAIDAACRLASN